jgi:inner membrane protein
MWQAWWMWVAGGVALGVLELLAARLYLPWLRAGGLATGALVGLGVLVSLPVTLAVFGPRVAGGLGRAALCLGRRAGEVKVITRDINDN